MRAVWVLTILVILPLRAEAFEGFPQTPPSPTLAWNIGAGDLFDPATAGCRLGVYLDELAAAGGPRQIRFVFTPGTGPFILHHWIPVIRAKGFRVLAILYQGSQDEDLEAQRQWIVTGLPQIADLLDGVEPSNEVNRDLYNNMGPKRYGRWHRQVAAWIRDAVPGVPILSPQFHDGDSKGYVKKTQLVYGVDFDIYSIHTTGYNAMKRWKWARNHSGVSAPRVWVTEGRPKQSRQLNEGSDPPRVERFYVYVWNCNNYEHADESGCTGYMLRPGGGEVPQCEVPRAGGRT